MTISNSNETSIPRPDGQTLAQVLAFYARTQPDAPVLFYGNEVKTYKALLSEVTQLAKSLLARRIGPKDSVGVLFGNEPRWLVSVLAISMVGATCVPLNTWYKQNELAWTLKHCGIRGLLAVGTFLKTDYAKILSELMPEIQAVNQGNLNASAFPNLDFVVLSDADLPGSVSWGQFLADGASQSDDALKNVANNVDPDAVAFVLYTSGSTAEPKGVMLTHKGIVLNGFDLGQRRGITADDRVWVGTPLFYALGAANALPATLTAGASLVLQGSFEAGEALNVIQRTGATVYYGTGNMSRALLDHPDYTQNRISTLKKGNAGTMTEYKRMTLVEMGISGAVPAYGLTETYGNATVGRIDDPLDVKLNTNGRPLPGMEIRIVDPDTYVPLPAGKTGLILVRGHTTPGYLNNPEETSKALRPDGFFDTGDLGHFDEEGRLIFHSRLKEVIKSGGINVSPIEVEQLLAMHPEVRDAYVVGVPDPVRGELIVAFVDHYGSITEEALRAHVKAQAASFKVPHHIFFRNEEALPRLATGKVAKHKLVIEAKHELGLA